MNIVNKLTLRQLKLNKKRTLVTIIGTIISAAMITAVATLGLSFMDIMQRESIASNGNWHVKYSQVNKQQLEGIMKNDKVKTTILSSEPGYAYLEGSQNLNKPYLYIKYFNKEGFDNFPIELKEGRLPEKPDEIVISDAVISNAKVHYAIGDTIDLTIGQRYSTAKNSDEIAERPMLQTYSLQWEEDKVAEKLTEDKRQSYKVVGMIKSPTWEFAWAPGYTVISYMDENTLTDDETFDVSVVFKKVNNKLLDTGDKIVEDYGITQALYNNDLLRYYGIFKDDTVRNMIYTLTAIILVIIMIGSVSLIYNAFAISVSERSRYLGMLSSVGATKRQKRNSVFFEGAVIGAISIPIGIAAGYIGLGITYIFINPMLQGAMGVTQGFRLKVYPISLITAVLVSGVTILISTFIPARKASNISAIDAIRQVSDIRINKNQVKTSVLTRKLFGIEGDLGLKNLKRNKGRYKATVFSLIISMLLFLVVSSFTEYMKKSLILTQDGINFDIQTEIFADSEKEKEDILNRMTSLENIKEKVIIKSLVASASIDQAAMADYLSKEDAAYQNGKYQYTITVNDLDDAALRKYTKEIGVEYKQLMDIEHPAAIVIDTVRYKDRIEEKYGEAKVVHMKVGDQLGLQLYDTSKADLVPLSQVKAAALTATMPTGLMTLGKTAGFHIIVSEAVFQKLTEEKEELLSKDAIITHAYFNSNKPLKLQQQIEEIQTDFGGSSISIYNFYQYRQREEQSLLLVSVFTYAFIILITAICVANIINTISTSITLRKREFAMLKSVGITPKGFNKMLNYESIFYGVKALVYGIPISFLAMYLMYKVLMVKFEYDFAIPYTSVYIVIVAVFIIVGTAMLYSSRRVRKENIIDALKQEII